MAEVLMRFAEPLISSDGVTYHARACGAPVADGRWEAWIEFHPADGTGSRLTPRETMQPNRADAQYWATGLSPVYLEGAFDRAQLSPAAASAPRGA